MMNRFFKTGMSAAILLAAAALPAVALPVIPNGSTFEVGGSLSGVGSAMFLNTTGLDFGRLNPDGSYTYGTPGGDVALAGTGSAFYRNMGFIAGTAGTAVDLPAGTFDGISGDTNGSTAKTVSFPSFYSFMKNGITLSFDLDQIFDVVRSTSSAGSGTQKIAVDGTGIVHLDGYQDAPATFSLLATRTGTGITTSFSSSVSADNTVIVPVSVPEPASMALLGAGLFGAGLVRRRKSK